MSIDNLNPKTEMDSEEYNSGSTIRKDVIGHVRIPKTELDNEESDAVSYTSSCSMDGEEMKNNYDDFEYNYVNEEEYDIENNLFCFCGRVAKRRMSSTARNPGRWFFNCSKKNFDTQCGYFQWCDELEADNEEDNYENGDEEYDYLTDDEEYEYLTDDEEVVSNYLDDEDEEMVSSKEEKSVLSYEVPTISVQPDQCKEMDLFPQYPDLDLLVQEQKPHIGLDGSILSIAPPGSPSV